MVNRNRIGLVSVASALLLSLSVAVPLPVQAQYRLQDRIDSAKRIIAQNEDFKLRAQKFHVQTKANVNEADQLRGEAEKLERQTKLHAQGATLDPARMKAAVKQYNSDVQAFRVHAQQYADHLRRMQASIGECHADADQYRINLKDYELHVSQYHIPNTPMIRPPHICGRMQLSTVESSRYANQLMMDQNRIFDAERALNDVEGRLQQSMNESDGLRTKAVREARREEVEQAVAGEYARLRDEFKTLEIERNAIAHSGAKGVVSSSSVSGKIKSSK